ncbi:hypothetical protein GCM10010504_48440 [Streptomyces griseus]|nr:hypothetical protein GCM10010504_48440 [Streptomyces griseus]
MNGTSLMPRPNQKLMLASGRGRRGATTAKKVHQVRTAVDATYPIGILMTVPPSHPSRLPVLPRPGAPQSSRAPAARQR